MIWYGFQSAFILGILPHRAKKVKTLWKVGSTQTSLQASTATLHGCNSTAISYPKNQSDKCFLPAEEQKSKHKCRKGFRGDVYRSLTFPRRGSHRSYYRNLTFQNIPMAMNMLLNKSASWEDFSLTGRTTLSQPLPVAFSSFNSKQKHSGLPREVGRKQFFLSTSTSQFRVFPILILGEK